MTAVNVYVVILDQSWAYLGSGVGWCL